MTELAYPRLREKVFHHKLGNGLNIYVNPRPEYRTAYAFFAAKYGSVDTRFRAGGNWVDTPMGTAHFLEHKLFDTKEGNALQLLSACGASPNAFTSFNMTGYYFETHERFAQALSILLAFVSTPYFTPESVDKEQGIIGQEIRMYEDDPGTAAYYGMLEGLYAAHPVRRAIAGTVESISHITADTLYACHEAFYIPGNMVLCVAGDVDPPEVCQLAEKTLPAGGKPLPVRDRGQEGSQAVRPRSQRRMEVSAPLMRLGWKRDPGRPGENPLRREIVGDLACGALMGPSSPLYMRLYREGLIDRGFSCGCEEHSDCGWLCAGGESRDPDAVLAAIEEERDRVVRQGVDGELFARLRKAAYGERICGFNSLEQVCVSLAEGCFEGYDPFSLPQIFESIRQEDVEECLCETVQPERGTLSIVLPKEERK